MRPFPLPGKICMVTCQVVASHPRRRSWAGTRDEPPRASAWEASQAEKPRTLTTASVLHNAYFPSWTHLASV